MNRIVVYGNASREKESYVSTLQEQSSRDISFLSSTSNERFTSVDTGRALPIYTASWQLLLVQLNDERLEDTPALDILFPECDSNRPLIIIFNGEENKKTKKIVNSYENDLEGTGIIKILSTADMKEVSADVLINEFHKLDNEKTQSIIHSI